MKDKIPGKSHGYEDFADCHSHWRKLPYDFSWDYIGKTFNEGLISQQVTGY